MVATQEPEVKLDPRIVRYYPPVSNNQRDFLIRIGYYEQPKVKEELNPGQWNPEDCL